MKAKYEVERIAGEEVLLQSSSRPSLGKVDSIVFDCDGVLIDSRQSYDATILKTVETMVEAFTGKSIPLRRSGGELILRIRTTGGFNNDWDTTYALAVFTVIAIDGSARDEGRKGARGAVRRLRELVWEFSSTQRLLGRASVDQYITERGLDSRRVRDLRAYLDFPVDHVHNRMTRTFDEMYFGAALFKRVFALKASVYKGRGLIEKERVLISEKSLKRLKEILGGGRLAISTGRPFVAVEYTLGRMLDCFDEDASVFIGDADIEPGLLRELKRFRKPSGASLVRAYEKLGSNTLLYVGDSAEDRLMVEDARRTYDRLFFGGISGTSFSEARQVEYFTKTGADIVMRTIGRIPDVLERLRA